MRAAHWLVSLLVAVFIHAALLFAAPSAQQEQYGALGEGEQGVEIGLGQAGSYLDQLQQKQTDHTDQPKPEATTPEELSTPEKLQPERKALAQPLLVAPSSKKSTPNGYVVEKPAVKAKPEKAIEPEQEQTTDLQEQSSNTTEDTKEKTVKSIDEQRHLNSQNDQQISKDHKTTVRASGRGKSTSSGGKVGNARAYFSLLMAQLNSHKRYPVEAKKKKQHGIVRVLFTLDAYGQVLKRSIQQSSGHPILDQAALAMFDQASPLPPIPEFMQRDSLTMVLPVDFSLITNNAYKE